MPGTALSPSGMKTLALCSPEGSEKVTICSVIPSRWPTIDDWANLHGTNSARHVAVKARIRTDKRRKNCIISSPNRSQSEPDFFTIRRSGRHSDTFPRDNFLKLWLPEWRALDLVLCSWCGYIGVSNDAFR